MARPNKRRVPGGGAPGKTDGGGSKRTTPSGGHRTPPASTRYTPPVPQSVKVSPRWVPVLVFTLLGLGLAVILLNYVGFLPGEPSNWYLVVGLGFILGGILTATQWH